MRTARPPLTLPMLLRRLVIGALVVNAAYYVLSIVLGARMVSVTLACFEEVDAPAKTASREEVRAFAVHHIDCIEAKLTFVERLFFDRDEAIASIHFKSRDEAETKAR
jgi:hypothetical protein